MALDHCMGCICFYLTLEECKSVFTNHGYLVAGCFYLTLEECKFINFGFTFIARPSFYLTLEECKCD